VWDPEENIAPTSPFPNRIYFILNLGRFLQTFGTLESMQEKLVWLPTWSQARQVAASLGIENSDIASLAGRAIEEGRDETLELYCAILELLNERGGR
jgi:hypothetical protein